MIEMCMRDEDIVHVPAVFDAKILWQYVWSVQPRVKEYCKSLYSESESGCPCTIYKHECDLKHEGKLPTKPLDGGQLFGEAIHVETRIRHMDRFHASGGLIG
jgi:hypothetical protein